IENNKELINSTSSRTNKNGDFLIPANNKILVLITQTLCHEEKTVVIYSQNGKVFLCKNIEKQFICSQEIKEIQIKKVPCFTHKIPTSNY
ncbi:MAG: hypothetical protein Q7K42_01060, partial [Candidatus Diapherotrites archaeon]|nr:hypothetical protein [Candidatus Diapherotrites archaeon]